MQKGETLCRCFVPSLISVLQIMFLSIMPCPVLGSVFGHAWQAGIGGVRSPGLADIHDWWDEDGAGLMMMASCRNLYSIDDLYSSRLEVEGRTRVILYSVSWGRLSNPIYSEDRGRVRIVPVFLPGKAAAGIIAGITRKKIIGLPHEMVISSSSLVILGSPDRFSVEAEFPLSDQKDAECRGGELRLAVRAGSVWFILGRKTQRNGQDRTGLGSLVQITGNTALMTGYRAGPGLLSFGLIHTRKRLSVALSWSSHPSLGNSYSAGISRGW